MDNAIENVVVFQLCREICHIYFAILLRQEKWMCRNVVMFRIRPPFVLKN